MSDVVGVMLSRADLRAALASVVPHAGRATKDNPHLGKLRWSLDTAAGELLIWAGDGNTMGVARVAIEADDAEPGVEQWDTTTNVVSKIVRVFKESDSHRDELDLGLMLTRKGLHLSEDDGLLPGEQLRVPRIAVPSDPEQDKTVDVPRAIGAYLGQPASTFGEAVVAARDLAAFERSAKAWGGQLGLLLVDEPFPRVLAVAGEGAAFLGLMHRLDARGDDVRNDDRRRARAVERLVWSQRLDQLARPEQVSVPPAVEESVLDVVREHLAAGADPIDLRVVREQRGQGPAPALDPFALDPDDRPDLDADLDDDDEEDD